MKNNCIILFVKYPQKGSVKTRLARDIGELKAVSLYRNFVSDALTTAENIDAETRVYFYPEKSLKSFRRWLSSNLTLMPQKGADLGERMKNAFLESFAAGYKKAVIVGSDSPDLPAELIEKAFLSMENKGAAIGPTHDGGYYLIGFNTGSFLPAIFDGIPWSTKGVYKKTISIFNKNNIKPEILTSWRDVDTIDDLEHLMKRNAAGLWLKSKTYNYLVKELKN